MLSRRGGVLVLEALARLCAYGALRDVVSIQCSTPTWDSKMSMLATLPPKRFPSTKTCYPIHIYTYLLCAKFEAKRRHSRGVQDKSRNVVSQMLPPIWDSSYFSTSEITNNLQLSPRHIVNNKVNFVRNRT